MKLKYIIIIIMLLSSCQSITTFIKNKEKETPASSKNPLIKKALVLYVSDDPNMLLYFSSSFTQRINEKGIFNAFIDNKINEEWLENNINLNNDENKDDINAEDSLKELSDKLKTIYLNKDEQKDPQQGRTSASIAMRKASSILANNPSSVGFSYAELAFWASILNLSSSRAKDYALIYEKYASLGLKDTLESLAEADKVTKLKELAKPFLGNQYTIQIKRPKNCLVFLNGQEVKSATVDLPDSMTSVLSANCTSGPFSQIFVPNKETTSLKVTPYTPSSVSKMPSLKALPKIISNSKTDALILIYWSHADQYIESYVLQAKDFSIVKKILLPLQTKKELDGAGDNLLNFIKQAATRY